MHQIRIDCSGKSIRSEQQTRPGGVVEEIQYIEKSYVPLFISGNDTQVEALVQQDILSGMTASEVVNKRLIATMEIVGQKYQLAQIFVPEMMIAARTMSVILGKLKDQLVVKSGESKGSVCIGTVRGDLHDIGKNLVVTMLEGHGFQVADLGVSVSQEKFLDAVKNRKPDILAMSALLTTTMVEMKNVLKTLHDAGLRNQVKVIVGGAPVTQAYADQIGADGYAAEAPSAVVLCKAMLNAT
jgi:5-methyltetrahydrofolate--homocysteine methyltransferase